MRKTALLHAPCLPRAGAAVGADPGKPCPIHAEGKPGRADFGMPRLFRRVGDDVDSAFDVHPQAAP